MFGSDTLDIAIGLVLVYLILSTLMTAVVEAIEALLKTRAGDLEQAIGQLLGGENLSKFYKQSLVFSLYRSDYEDREPSNASTRIASRLPSYIPREIFSAAVLDLVKKDPKGTLKAKIDSISPGLLESASAVETALKTLGNAVDPDAIVKAQAAVHSAQVALARQRHSLELWFDSAMDRASGVFKRRTQFRLLIMGLLLAVGLNVNSVVIAQYLATHPAARAAALKLANETQRTAPVPHEAPSPKAHGTDSAAADNASDVAAVAGNATATDNVVAPAATPATPAVPGAASKKTVDCYSLAAVPTEPGSTPVSGNTTAAAPTALENQSDNQTITNEAAANSESTLSPEYRACRDLWVKQYWSQLQDVGLPIGWDDGTWNRVRATALTANNKISYLNLFVLLLGYLATAFAVMLGAPLWFDVLGKLMVIRSTVKPKQKSPDEPPTEGR